MFVGCSSGQRAHSGRCLVAYDGIIEYVGRWRVLRDCNASRLEERSTSLSLFELSVPSDVR
jgi:hypothetical protein